MHPCIFDILISVVCVHLFGPKQNTIGYLDLQELNTCISEYMGSDISLELTQTVCSEFDKDATDTIDKAEFTMMVVRILFLIVLVIVYIEAMD